MPHYYNEEESGSRFGSCRSANKWQRFSAFVRSVCSYLSLQERAHDLQINFQHSRLEIAADRRLSSKINSQVFEPTEVLVTVCINNDDFILEALSALGRRIEVVRFNLEDPRMLPLRARDHLLSSSKSLASDFLVYSEDDLVVTDRDFLRKISSFYSVNDASLCLMPHRYERIDAEDKGLLLVDGPLNPEFIQKFYTPLKGSHSWMSAYGQILLDIPENPHSGFFCISKQQACMLKKDRLPERGFVGPLETAATYTVMQNLTILKPNICCYNFLVLEHAHPSHYMVE